MYMYIEYTCFEMFRDKLTLFVDMFEATPFKTSADLKIIQNPAGINKNG